MSLFISVVRMKNLINSISPKQNLSDFEDPGSWPVHGHGFQSHILKLARGQGIYNTWIF